MIKINGQDEGLVINNDDFANTGALASLKSLINTNSRTTIKGVGERGNKKKTKRKYINMRKIERHERPLSNQYTQNQHHL
jgi:ribosomal protein L18E